MCIHTYRRDLASLHRTIERGACVRVSCCIVQLSYWVFHYRKNNFFIRGSLQIAIFKLLRFSALLLLQAITFFSPTKVWFNEINNLELITKEIHKYDYKDQRVYENKWIHNYKLILSKITIIKIPLNFFKSILRYVRMQ